MLIRVASAIGGIWPIDLLALERKRIHGNGGLAAAKYSTLEDWHARWNSNFINAQWTKRLIPNLEP